MRSRGPGEWVWRVEKALQGRRPAVGPALAEEEEEEEEGLFRGWRTRVRPVSRSERERERERLYQETVSINQ